MKYHLIKEIEIPDDATHFTGDLKDNPTWWKQKEVAGFPVWMYWDSRHSSEWMISGDHKPWWAVEIKQSPITELINHNKLMYRDLVDAKIRAAAAIKLGAATMRRLHEPRKFDFLYDNIWNSDMKDGEWHILTAYVRKNGDHLEMGQIALEDK